MRSWEKPTIRTNVHDIVAATCSQRQLKRAWLIMNCWARARHMFVLLCFGLNWRNVNWNKKHALHCWVKTDWTSQFYAPIARRTTRSIGELTHAYITRNGTSERTSGGETKIKVWPKQLYNDVWHAMFGARLRRSSLLRVSGVSVHFDSALNRLRITNRQQNVFWNGVRCEKLDWMWPRFSKVDFTAKWRSSEVRIHKQCRPMDFGLTELTQCMNELRSCSTASPATLSD